MKVVILKNGSDQVYKYLDNSGNEIKPERPSSRVSEVIEVDFDPRLAKISGGVVSKNDVKEAKENAEAAVLSAYSSMIKDIYDEMYKVFSTRNDVSAQATASTYEAMAKRPANYVGLGGLVDESAVKAYAETKIAEADAYAIFRLTRIAKFQSDREAILNS